MFVFQITSTLSKSSKWNVFMLSLRSVGLHVIYFPRTCWGHPWASPLVLTLIYPYRENMCLKLLPWFKVIFNDFLCFDKFLVTKRELVIYYSSHDHLSNNQFVLHVLGLRLSPQGGQLILKYNIKGRLLEFEASVIINRK